MPKITIDEIDFPANIHGMKYHFIQTLKNPLAQMMGAPKDRDFAYWGRMKPSERNQREKTIRSLNPWALNFSCSL